MKHLLSLLALLALLSPASSRAADAADSGRVELPPFKKVVFDNGLTVLLLERHQLPLINFHWLLKTGGSINDPAGREGVAYLTAQLLRKGTAARSADQFSEAVDFVGGACDAGASLDFATGEAEFLKKDSALALELLSDMLEHPTFPTNEITKLVQQEIDGITEAKSVPRQVMGRYFNRFLFGQHPYARPVGGDEKTLAVISPEDIVSFYSSHYAPNAMILAVVGDFAAADMESALRKSLGAWASKKVDATPLPQPAKITGRHVLMIDKPDSTQTFFELGNVGLERTNADWVGVEVVNTLFGGRFTSMINNELRIQSGLTYGAASHFSSHPLPGSFTISSYTPNATTERAIDMALDVLKRLHEKGITDAQLKSAKAYIKGQFGPTMETSDQLAGLLTDLEFYGLGSDEINRYFERIDAVTLADAKRIIETYYPLDGLSFVLIGQSAVVEPVAKKLATDIAKKSITDPGF